MCFGGLALVLWLFVTASGCISHRDATYDADVQRLGFVGKEFELLRDLPLYPISAEQYEEMEMGRNHPRRKKAAVSAGVEQAERRIAVMREGL